MIKWLLDFLFDTLLTFRVIDLSFWAAFFFVLGAFFVLLRRND